VARWKVQPPGSVDDGSLERFGEFDQTHHARWCAGCAIGHDDRTISRD
jgi:hypothetical protein